MIDIHCHLLPGLDDGAPDLEQSIAMCRAAAEDGCTAMIATPHLRHQYWWNDDRTGIENLYRRVRREVGEIVDLRLGGEIAVHSESCSELYALPAGNLLTLAGSRYLLLEFDHHGPGPDPLELIHELRIAGWFPILAHPERIAWLAGQTSLVRQLVEDGAHLQITAMSLTGELGRRLQDLTVSWIESGLVDFVASDAHRIDIRPPGLSPARQTLTRLWGEETARRLLFEHPLCILEDRPLDRQARGESVH